MTFYTGQKVVAVVNEDKPFMPKPWIVKGEVYTIAWAGCIGGVPAVDLVEIPHPIIYTYGYARAYRASAFRPAVDRKTDISIFQRILKTREVEDVS